jgi:excisionase family DNA binding protein
LQQPTENLTPERRTYTLREAAALLNIPKSTAYDLAARDQFPVAVIRAGRRVYVAKALVDAIAPDPGHGRVA